MPWVTPKTNWQPGNGVFNTDLNRIEGNTEELNRQVVDTNNTLNGHRNTADVHRKITYGTANPPSSGQEGNIYLQYEV